MDGKSRTAIENDNKERKTQIENQQGYVHCGKPGMTKNHKPFTTTIETASQRINAGEL